MTKYVCPDWPRDIQRGERNEPDIIGCGQQFEAEPDDEGLVDCPHCGIWFNPAKEPKTIIGDRR